MVSKFLNQKAHPHHRATKPKDEANMILRTLFLPASLDRKLKSLAEHLDISKAELMRNTLEAQFKRK